MKLGSVTLSVGLKNLDGSWIEVGTIKIPLVAKIEKTSDGETEAKVQIFFGEDVPVE